MDATFCLAARWVESGQTPIGLKTGRQIIGRREAGGRGEDRLALARRLLDDYLARQPAETRARRVVTGLSALDEALGGGLPLGALCQMGSAMGGVGALTLALRLAREAAGPETSGRFIFLIDSAGGFYPPAAMQCGANLERLVIVRHSQPRQSLWATEQILRCSAAGAVIGLWPKFDERALRRLQLAAEAGGGIGLLVHGAGRMPATPFAAARLMVEPLIASKENPTLPLPLARGGNKTHTFSELPPRALLNPLVREGNEQRESLLYRQRESLLYRRLVRVHLSLRRRALNASIVLDLHHATGDVSLHAVSGDRSGGARVRASG